ncbi:MAG: nitric oxide reductase [Betaproteobacteria bacterium]|nr:nitric oxide reductase [Betaproteobacteria bacterium]
MEERVGRWVHGLLTRLAREDFPAQAAEFPHQAALWFRAFGGDPALAVQRGADGASAHARGLRQRLAGSGQRAGLAWVDAEALRLPPQLARYARRDLNQDLYFWLVALAAASRQHAGLDWFARNQAAAAQVLAGFEALRPRYRRLLEAELARRPMPERLAPAQAEQERAIRQALADPGSVPRLPWADRPCYPVGLWLRPDSARRSGVAAGPEGDGADARGNAAGRADPVRREAQRVQPPRPGTGLLLPRQETIHTLAQYARMDLDVQDQDTGDSTAAAEDLDVLSVVRDGRVCAKAVRMELDVAAAEPAPPAASGPWLLPEWDYRSAMLRPDRCVLREITPSGEPQDGPAGSFPRRLEGQRKSLQRLFQNVQPQRARMRAQADGTDIDLDRYLRQRVSAEPPERVHIDVRAQRRDLSCLLLADLSLSTDSTLADGRRVLDVIRDGLLLFAETLAGAGDRFAIYGFQSRGPADVRLQRVKAFGEPHGRATRARIAGLQAADYTRMGAALRACTRLLERENTRERLLLLLTDGKPNDKDLYEGRYGIEDTRQAFLAARGRGLRPFCVTIDQQAQDYLPHAFGRHRFAIVRNAAELPQRLTLLYAQLARPSIC